MCRGTVSEETVTLAYPDGAGNVRIIRGVPAGVCQQCHNKYLTVETSRMLDNLLNTPPTTEAVVPVWKFVPSE